MDTALYDNRKLISKVELTHGDTSKILADGLDGDVDELYEIITMVDVHVTTGWAFLELQPNSIANLVDTWYTYSGHRGDVGDHYAQGTNSYDGFALGGIKSADGHVNGRTLLWVKTGTNRQAMTRAAWAQSNVGNYIMYWHHLSSILKETSTNITKLTLIIEGGTGIHFASGYVCLYRLR